MKIIVATGIVLLSLSSVAEAHRLSGTATYYGGGDRLCGSRTASGARFNCGAMTAAHRTLPFGTVLTVQKGGRSIQVTVTDRGPFTGAFLDLSPAAASALGCRCTHRNVTATVVQMGSGGTVVASRGRQRFVAAAAMPLFQPTADVRAPVGIFGSTMAMAPARTIAVATLVATRIDPSPPTKEHPTARSSATKCQDVGPTGISFFPTFPKDFGGEGEIRIPSYRMHPLSPTR
jgi:rare lipoprotein A (peptidoglycan hydrolase)